MKFYRAFLPYLLGGTVLFVFGLTVQHRRGSDYLRKAAAFEEEGRLEEAIGEYEWAIQSYFPFSSAPGVAVNRLERIASDAQIRGATNTAIRAWQAVVSGLLVIEHSSQPYPDRLEGARAQLEQLRTRKFSGEENSKSSGFGEDDSSRGDG